MKIRDLMRTEYVHFTSDDTLEHIVQEFVKNHITSAPVFDGKEFLGVISDKAIVKYFIPKKFQFFWKKDKESPIDDVKKFIAVRAIKKPSLVLKPETELATVLKDIVNETDCIPVMENAKLVGVLRSEDLTKYFLREFAKYDYQAELESAGVEQDKIIGTVVDDVLEIVKRKGKVSLRSLARDMGLTVKTLEKLGETLHNHQLARIKYSFFGGAELWRMEHEKR